MALFAICRASALCRPKRQRRKFNTRLFLLFVESRDKIEDYIHVSEFVILTNRTAADKITAIYHSYLISNFSVYAHLWINKHIKHIKTVAAGI